MINAAGVESDRIHNMVAPSAFEIVPTRGEYYLLDGTAAGHVVGSVIFPCPTRAGKGITVSPTIHGDYLVGPNAEVIADRSDTSVTRSALLDIAEKRRVVPNLDLRTSIRNLRVFVQTTRMGISLSKNQRRNSSTSPPSSRRAGVRTGVARVASCVKRTSHGRRTLWRRASRHPFQEIPEEERAAFVREHPLYGSDLSLRDDHGKQIVAAMKRNSAVSIDGVKRRAEQDGAMSRRFAVRAFWSYRT